MLKARYSHDELTALIEGYQELRWMDNKAWILVRLIDLQRAIAYLPEEQRAAVLLVGFLGYSTRQASSRLNVSHTTVAKRYQMALEVMSNFLNGDYHR